MGFAMPALVTLGLWPTIRDTTSWSAAKSASISSRLLERMFEYYRGLPTRIASGDHR
jgi:hypothetical protein